MKSLPFCLTNIEIQSLFVVDNFKFLACSTMVFSKKTKLSAAFLKRQFMIKGLSQITKRIWGDEEADHA